MARKKKRKFLICDDHIESSEKWQSDILQLPVAKRLFDVEICSPDKLREQIEVLSRRRLALRKKQLNVVPSDSVFDDLSVLVVDYDLQDQDPRSGREIAYLVRCFSQCGLVVTINEHGENPFDLTLTDFEDSFADINIGAAQLNNPGLWGNGWSGFRPWAWPLLPRAIEDIEARIEQVSDLNTKVLEFLGLQDIESYMSKGITTFLSPAKKTIGEVTFFDFLSQSEKGLTFRDREHAASLPDEMKIRIVAARLAHWLERVVLPGQHILVDAPHLVSRHPSFLRARSKDESNLNKTAQLERLSKLGLKYKDIERHEFAARAWLSREAWMWPSLSKDTSIAAIADPWSEKSLDSNFCEDSSSFLPANQTREFSADVQSQFVRRHLVNLDSCKNTELLSEVQDVQFFPSARLAL